MRPIILALLMASGILTAPAAAQVQPGARITNISGVPDPRGSADVTSSTVWLEPFRGDQEPVYYQGGWVAVRVSVSLTDTIGQSLASPYWTGGAQFDLFITTQDGVTPFFCSGHTAWPNPNTTNAQRGLVKINGIWVNGAVMQCDGTISSFSCPQYQCTHVGSINPPNAGSSGAPGTPTVFASLNSGAAGVQTYTTMTTAPIAAGNLAVIAVWLNFNNGPLISSAMVNGNAYSPGPTSGLVGCCSRVQFLYLQNSPAIPSGSNVTVTLSAAGTGGSDGFVMQGWQVSGVVPSGALDQGPTCSPCGGSGISTYTATTAALSQPQEIVFGANWDGNASLGYTEPAGYANLTNTAVGGGNGLAVLDYLFTTSAAPASYGPAWSANNDRLAVTLAAFKLASAPPTSAMIGFQAADGQNRRVDFSNRYNQLPLTLYVVAPWNKGQPCSVYKPGGDPNIICWQLSNQYAAWVPFNNDAANSATVFLTDAEHVEAHYSQNGYLNNTSGVGGWIAPVGWDGLACGFFNSLGVDNPNTFIGGKGATSHCLREAVLGVHTATQFAAAANNLVGGVLLWSGYNPAAAPGMHYSVEYENLMTVTYPF